MNELVNAVASRRAFLKSAAAVAGTGLLAGCASRTVTTAALPAAPIPVPAPPVATPIIQPVQISTAPRGIRPELFQRAMAALQRHGSRIRQQDRIAIADFSVPSSRLRFHFVDLHNGAVRSMLVSHGIGSDPGHTGMLQRFSNEVNSEATCEGAFLASNYYVGKLGRSQGCFAVGQNELDKVFTLLGEGRMIYAEKTA